MKKNFLIYYLFIFFYLNLSYAENIAYIDLNYIVNNSIAGKKVINKLEVINKKNFDILNEEMISLNDEKNNIESQKNILSQKELETKIIELNNKFEKFNLKKENTNNKFNSLRQSELKNFFIKINPVIENYMLNENIDIVLKKESIYISKTKNDITKLIIDLINEKNLNNDNYK